MKAVICPVSGDRVDESATRVGATLVMLTVIVGLVSGIVWIHILLAIDFALRAFTQGNYSPIKILARYSARRYHLPVKPIDAAPKRFASSIGFVFSSGVALFQFLEWDNTAIFSGLVLVFCAMLESFFAYCLGCVVYTYLVLPLIPKEKI